MTNKVKSKNIQSVKRYSTSLDYENLVPIFVVWELTLACNLSCNHCGSRAGKARPSELNLSECYDIINQLKKLGTREIALIGGEAFLKKDWLKVVEKITEVGIDCSMQTGALNFGEDQILNAKNAGIKNVGISIDGLKEYHNELRGNINSFDSALNSLKFLSKHNIQSSINTTITRQNKEQLSEILDLLIEHKVKNWQLQIAVAMGNAVDNENLILQPYELKDIHDNVAKLYIKALSNNLLIQPGNNFGYFGPYEHIWRGGNFGYFGGCSAGHTAMGIESDGTIKGCPSLRAVITIWA